MRNCGLVALEKIKDIKGVSAFTLIHLAKDNGVDLKIFKVKLEDLPLVHRPAIFHAPNHFEHIKNGEPLPDLKWTGYVLTQKSIGIPISHKEAKHITGEAPVAALIVPAIKAVATFAITTVIPGAATGALVGGAIGAATGQGFGKGVLEGAKFGGIAAGAGGMLGAAAGKLASATKGATSGIGKAISSGAAKLASSVPLQTAAAGAIYGGAQDKSIVGALKGGLAGYGVGTGVQGINKFAQGFNAASGNLGEKLVAGYHANFPTAAQKALPGQVDAFNKGTSAALASNIASGAKYFAGNMSPNISSGYGLIGQGSFSRANLGVLSPKISSAASAALSGGVAANSRPDSGDMLKRAGLAGAVQLAGNALGPKRDNQINFDPTKEFTVLRDFLGDQALPQATEKELMDYVHTPLTELTNRFSPQRDKIVNQINRSYDLRDAAIRKQYASFGQNEHNSSDAAEQLKKSQFDRAQSIAEAQQEFESESLSRAIQAKQFALTSSIQNNQFDQGLALELADAIGAKENMETALRNEDYAAFQDLMAQILNIGFGSPYQNA